MVTGDADIEAKLEKAVRAAKKKQEGGWLRRILRLRAWHPALTGLALVVAGPALIVALTWVNVFVKMSWQPWVAVVSTAFVVMVIGGLVAAFFFDDLEEWTEDYFKLSIAYRLKKLTDKYQT